MLTNELDVHVLDDVFVYKGRVEFSTKNSKATVYDLREVINEFHTDIKENFLTDTFMDNSYHEISHRNEIDEISLLWDDLDVEKTNYTIPFYIVSKEEFDEKIQSVVRYYTRNFELDEKALYHQLIFNVDYHRTTFDLSIPSIRHIQVLSDVFFQEDNDELLAVTQNKSNWPTYIHNIHDAVAYTELYVFSTASIEGLNRLIKFAELYENEPVNFNRLIELDGTNTKSLLKAMKTVDNTQTNKLDIDNMFLLNYFNEIQDWYIACGRNAAINVINQHAKPIITKYLRTY